MPVSLQINLAPGDLLYARHILPHQLKTLAKQVDEIVLTIETRPSKGRFAAGWNENRQSLYDFLERDIKPKYNVRIDEVDYGKTRKEEIANYFFGSKTIAEKDFRGGPFYAYFYGIYSASHDMVFHLDADMFLGGTSPSWVQEASKFLGDNRECLFVSPLPGPPHPEDRLTGQPGARKIAPYTYVFDTMSTRIFMTDRSRMRENPLRAKKPVLRNQLKALVEGNPREELPEHLFADLMKRDGLKRIDFLGTAPGLWSLHPPYRSKSFYESLPTIISQIEAGNLPESQKGFYDVVDEVCDWSEAKLNIKNNRWWKRLLHKS
jgi:hypothetical protein